MYGQRSRDTRVLVRQCDCRYVLVVSAKQVGQPSMSIDLPFELPNDRSSTVDEQRAQIRITTLADPLQIRLSTGRVLLTRSNNAANCRPFSKFFASPTEVTKALP